MCAETFSVAHFSVALFTYPSYPNYRCYFYRLPIFPLPNFPLPLLPFPFLPFTKNSCNIYTRITVDPHISRPLLGRQKTYKIKTPAYKSTLGRDVVSGVLGVTPGGGRVSGSVLAMPRRCRGHPRRRGGGW